ncbi:uncharacterized protein B0I36DRAFT_289566 [Microdochium trichocladiopsis]|uniref:FAD synthase n=1 Tax=Microdochium trichocladiopsis TaxID=1682393 RepID=A0A9P8Y5C4_9PEZI|nr:uncharacterized protein B0I36DRAFT_289566 [Microdochium trichocladiopsis]KAH7031477.1 hypothetical protein B0I36DRAFT_289566 [Microdochium trichocladiopsis]
MTSPDDPASAPGGAPPILNGTTSSSSSSVAAVPPSHSLEALCHALHARVEALLGTPTQDPILRDVQAQVRIANDVVDDALRRYQPNELSLSYNGGKDCLVLLLLLLARLPAHFSSPSAPSAFPTSLQALYIRPPQPFPEVDAFVASSTKDYHLDLATSDKPMKPALADYLADKPNIKAVFVGTRRTDPHGGKLTFFDETDRDWPRFMRIHPVIDWHYREIWGFIRALQVPYCPLYDMGYTSLGGTDDTLPNPALKAHEGKPTNTGFRPAYELMDDDEERLGRE